MSLGRQLLRAICESSDRTTLRQLTPSMFLPDELPALIAIQGYFLRHGSLPTPELLMQDGCHLDSTRGGTVEHFRDRILVRTRYNLIQAAHGRLGDVARDGVGAVDRMSELVAETGRELARIELSDDLVALPGATNSIMDLYGASMAGHVENQVTLGWHMLDAAVGGGANPGDIITLVARPGMGKSYLLIHMALQAWLSGKSVLFVTMEMDVLQIVRRMMGVHMHMNPEWIRQARLPTMFGVNFRERLDQCVTDFQSGANFYLVRGTLSKSVSDVASAIHEIGPDITYVDAAYLVKPSNGRGGKRHEVMTEVGEEMKGVALDTEKPIVQTVQFNRTASATKGGGDISMIGGTDTIGQVSSVVVGIKNVVGRYAGRGRRLELLKNREGETDLSFPILFQVPEMRFDYFPQMDREEREDAPGLQNQGVVTDTVANSWRRNS